MTTVLAVLVVAAAVLFYLGGGWWTVSKIERRVRAWRIFRGRRKVFL